MTQAFHEMPGGRGLTRTRSLTSETKKALYSTLMGTVGLVRKMLCSNFKYVLTAKFQSDDLEGEFGVYRQLSGGMYFIGVEQIMNSANIRSKKLLSELGNIENVLTEDHEQKCCSSPVTDDELRRFDEAVENSEITESESAALYYIG